ncbi:MAG TPA: hypothetical protein VHM91_16205 [Verrucomicrobiales bacterium]|jgi:hypothetical protein|nr:hypothetical protein [Verrucomicrobiales bacterium]
MSASSPAIPKKSESTVRQKLKERAAEVTAGGVLLLLALILAWRGDWLVDQSAGRTARWCLVGAAAALFVLLTYCLLLLRRFRPAVRTIRENGMLWKPGEKNPLCPHCHDKSGKLIYLNFTGPTYPSGGEWQCPSCEMRYLAGRTGTTFAMRI